MKIRKAPFALRVVRRREGDAAVVYRRALDVEGHERLRRLAALSALAFSAGAPLLRAAVRATEGAGAKLTPGPFHPLDADWGARVACFALLAAGLRDGARLFRAAENLRTADATEAAWWLGHLTRPTNDRAVRALRILTEAVQ